MKSELMADLIKYLIMHSLSSWPAWSHLLTDLWSSLFINSSGSVNSGFSSLSNKSFFSVSNQFFDFRFSEHLT